ncbi:hypothetical protein FAVG1_04214 [Fusarium avenaceum]|nr:hypothetical protein FAVG1_04214 [Fusarium avenaceum]
MMKSSHHSSIEKRGPKDAPPPVADASGSKTPVRQQSIPHQARTPSSHKSMTAKQATPSLARDKETGPYIRFKKPCYKPGSTSAPPFDRTSAEEGSKRTMDLPSFTYSQKPLMNFESNDAQPPKDAPKGPRADRFKMRNTTDQRGSISSSSSSLPVARPDSGLGSGSIHHANALAAAIKAQTAPEIARKHLGGTCKIKVMELCLSLKDEYLAMIPAPLHDQEPFWSHLLEKLESNSVTRGKFKNEVFVQRFCKINRGYFKSIVWSPLVVDKISGMVKTHVKNWISDSLMKRRGELGRFARPTLLPKSSSTADYQNVTRDVQTLFDASNRDERQTLDTEVLLSIIIDLKPGLKSAISRRLNRNNSDNTARSKQEADNSSNPSNAHTELNSTEARIPPPARDQKSTTQPLTESCNSRELKGSGTIRPGATHGIPPRPPSRYDIDQSASKRKLSDPPSTSLAISSNRTIRDTVEQASNTTTQHEAKRQRLDEGRLSFADSNPLPRRQPSPPRRSRRNDSNKKKTRYSNPNDAPLKPRTPRRPASPSPPRNAPYRQRSDYREQRYTRESGPHEYLDSWRPGTDRNHERPRDWRENTVEFQRMPTERQNLSLRNQMKGMEEQLKALVERNRR